METTKISSQGTVVIPQNLRDLNQWETGQELIVINTNEGILLKPKPSFSATKLEDVAGCLNYQGEAQTLTELEDAIHQGVLEQER